MLAEFLHKRQLKQEEKARAGLPESERHVSTEEEAKEREVENKLVGVMEPVLNSSTVM